MSCNVRAGKKKIRNPPKVSKLLTAPALFYNTPRKRSETGGLDVRPLLVGFATLMRSPFGDYGRLGDPAPLRFGDVSLTGRFREPVFANICVQKRMNRFTSRTKTKVDVQWRLFAPVHNIGKIHSFGAIH